MNQKKHLIVIVLCLSIIKVNAQVNEIEFKHYTTQDGLSSDFILSIVQDNSGFLWFGTEAGLSKFDGYTFKNFYGQETDTASIPAGLITTIYKDANGSFWLGSYTDGVCIFNPITEESRRINYLQGDSLSYFNNQVTRIIQDQSGNIWIGTLNGLNCYDPKTKTSVHFEHDPNDSLSLSSNGIRSLFIDHNGALWIGTGNWNNWEHYPGGLNRFDPSTKTFKRYVTDDIISINEDNNNVLYIGTSQSLLYRYNRNKDSFELWWKPKNLTKPSSQLWQSNVNLLPAIFDLEHDRAGNFWIGSFTNGVYKISPTMNSVQHFEYNSQKGNSLSANTVGSIFQDEQGIIWIGTDAGVNKVVPSQKRFSQLRSKPEILTELGNRRVHSFLKDSHSNLWMGLANGDLYCFDGSRTTHWNIQKQIYVTPAPLSLIYEDEQKELWLSGTGCGLIQFSSEKGILKRFTPNPENNSSLTFWEISAIVQDRHGNLWLGGGYNGADIFNPNTETFVNYRNNKQNSRSISNDIVSSIIKDSDNQIWIGTQNGLNLYREKTNDFDRFLPGIDIRKIFVDSISRFWIGTRHQGLILFNRQTGTYKTYTKYDGLPSNFTNNIVEDNDGNIWIGSPAGLTRFQPSSESFISFDTQDGVDNIFTLEPDAAVKLHSGEILFGGTKGITSFSPENIKINKFPPKVVITDVALFKNSINKDINLDSTFSFNYDQNDFTFEYVGVHFANPLRNTYAVKLEPYENDWQYVGTLRKARYTSLQPGSYTFSVKAANSDGVWSDGTKTFKFTMLPPWWKTWWAYSFFTFIIFGFLYSTRKFELNRQRKNSEIKESKLRAEAAEFQAKAAEAQSRIIQAENERKSIELEEARQLQLSMLPNEIPSLPHLDIAVYMKTATEVGGDYYDFHVGLDGTLTVVVGDATGHGMKAGTMVTSTKSLFNTLAPNPNIIETFHEMTRCLKLMHMEKLSMCMIMLKIIGNKIQMSSAGMPPVFLYQKENQTVEELVMKGMPLGTFADFPYVQKEREINSGDTILLVSDGLPELFNQNKEMFGYKRMKNVFEESAEKNPEEIIKELKDVGSNWTNDKDPDDDVTFVVIKIK